MKRKLIEIDHIDPQWKEGRDYQLVCGLDCPLNYREEDWIRNTIKSNRFLPWRWVRDEVGVVPEEVGDLALFLVGADIENDVPGEWVLVEFLSEEWFSLTTKTGGQSRGGRVAGPKSYSALETYYEENPEARRKHSKLGAEKTKKLFLENPEESRRRFLCNGGPEKLEEYFQSEEFRKNCSAAGIASTKTKYKCLETGKVSTFNGLTIYQRNRGIDLSKRIKLISQEAKQ